MNSKNRSLPNGDLPLAPELDALLEQFAYAPSAAQRRWAAEELARGKHVNTVRGDPRFDDGLSYCLTPGQDPEALLAGISIAYRLAAASKPVMAKVKQIVIGRLDRPLPPFILLPNAKDRYYVALALEDARGDWLDAYIARAIAEDDSAELARAELAHRLLARRTLGDSLRLIAEAMREVRFETGKPAESAARRMRRICEALRPSVVKDVVAAGADVGQALKLLFGMPTRVGPFVPGDKPWAELAEEACGLVRDILRTQLSLLAETDVYLSLQHAAAWLDPRMWPRFVKKSPGARAVLTTLLDALALLAKQRVTDQRLLTTLEFLAGGREAALGHTAALVAKLPGLDSEVAEWLMCMGRERIAPLLTSLDTANQNDADAYIASLLLITAGWSQDTDRDAAAQRAALEVERLARARSLAVRLAQGDVIEYAPSAHELVGGHRLGVRLVRVVQPQVERYGTSGAGVVVQKAIVEAEEG